MSRALQISTFAALASMSAPAFASDPTGIATVFVGIPMFALVNVVFGILLLGRPQKLIFGMTVLFWFSVAIAIALIFDAISFMAKSRTFESDWYLFAGLAFFALFALTILQYSLLRKRSIKQSAREPDDSPSRPN